MDLSFKNERYLDVLSLPYSNDEDLLMKNIYDTLVENKHHRKLKIIIDSLDYEFISLILKSFDAIKLLGYNDISLEARIFQNVNIDDLTRLIGEYRVPIKIKYYLSSSDDKLRERLTKDIRIRIDPDLVNLSSYQELVRNDLNLSKQFKRANKNLFVGEIVYELNDGENNSLYECALLQYYASRYNLAITLLGDKKSVNTWIEQISKYSKDIVILNQNKKTDKVLTKRIAG